MIWDAGMEDGVDRLVGHRADDQLPGLGHGVPHGVRGPVVDPPSSDESRGGFRPSPLLGRGRTPYAGPQQTWLRGWREGG